MLAFECALPNIGEGALRAGEGKVKSLAIQEDKGNYSCLKIYLGKRSSRINKILF
jgi:hypothetical protein